MTKTITIDFHEYERLEAYKSWFEMSQREVERLKAIIRFLSEKSEKFTRPVDFGPDEMYSNFLFTINRVLEEKTDD